MFVNLIYITLLELGISRDECKGYCATIITHNVTSKTMVLYNIIIL